MRRLPTLVAALLLPAAQPLLLGTAVSAGALVVSQSPAHAESAEAVAKVAQAITVRIEGATQGSGVLVKRDGNRYTVLTAWHVVSGQRPGEELDIYTPDGQKHSLEAGSIKRLGEVDLAVLTFSSSNSYEPAQIGDVKSVSMGSPIYVAGFPLPTSAVPTRLLRFLDGKVIANATVAIPNGYQLLYSNPTLPGMSGGAALNAQAQLVGIHGQGETDSKMSEQEGVAVKTGTNQAVPIAYYRQFSSGAAVVASSTQPTTSDDYLAQVRSLSGKKGKEVELIRAADQALLISKSAEAYLTRGNARYSMGDVSGAINDYSLALSVNSQLAEAYYNRGSAKSYLGDKVGAVDDFNLALLINPLDYGAYAMRGLTSLELGDFRGAIGDLTKSLSIYPRDSNVYNNRGLAKMRIGDATGAITDYSQSVHLDPNNSKAFNNRGLAKAGAGDIKSAISDYTIAIGLSSRYANAYGN